MVRTRTVVDLRALAERLQHRLVGSVGGSASGVDNHNRVDHLTSDELRSAYVELQRAHERMRAVFELAPIAYVVLDDTGGVRAANRAACELVGLPAQDLVGIALERLMPDANVDPFRRFLHGASATHELELHAGGRTHHVIAHATHSDHGHLIVLRAAHQPSAPPSAPPRAARPRTASSSGSSGPRFAVGTQVGMAPLRDDRKTILIAEDNLTTQGAIREHLETLGHRVISASDVGTALAAARAHTLDVALLEYRLRGSMARERGAGVTLACRLRELQPTLQIVITSGYPREDVNADAPFLQKPFSLDELTRAVSAAIDTARA
jgi:PAS domain S-box-containing protein